MRIKKEKASKNMKNKISIKNLSIISLFCVILLLSGCGKNRNAWDSDDGYYEGEIAEDTFVEMNDFDTEYPIDEWVVFKDYNTNDHAYRKEDFVEAYNSCISESKYWSYKDKSSSSDSYYEKYYYPNTTNSPSTLTIVRGNYGLVHNVYSVTAFTADSIEELAARMVHVYYAAVPGQSKAKLNEFHQELIELAKGSEDATIVKTVGPHEIKVTFKKSFTEFQLSITNNNE